MENTPLMPPENPYIQQAPLSPPPPPPPLFNKYLEEGRSGKNDWWRYLIGIVLTLVAGYTLIGQAPLFILILRGLRNGNFTMAELQNNQLIAENPARLGVDKNVLLACLLFIFVAAMIFLWIAVRFIHRKRFMSLIAPAGEKFSFRRYFLGFGIWMVFSIILLVISYFSDPSSFHFVFQPLPFFGSLVICLLMLPIQTGWEELFVRGYLMQGLGLLLKKPLVPWLLTSLLFGLLHMANAEVSAHGWMEMLPQYILPGLVFGAITLMDERQELALGLHFANNIFGILSVSSPEMSIQANSIWWVPDMGGMGNIIAEAVPLLLVVVILQRVYRWDFKKLYC